MRELKFRVWHKEIYRFLTPEEWFIDFNGQLKFWDFDFETLQIVNKDLYVIQQFTGLKDKNNKEIYEGDLVKVWKEHEAYLLKSIFHDKEYSLDYTYGEIIWLCESFKVCQKYIGATYLNEFATCGCCPCALEIIGNIFKTPNLILK